MRDVWKVRVLTLLLRFGTLWRCGDGLFSKYLPWQAMHCLQRSTHFSKTCFRPLITSKFLVDRWNSIRTFAIQSRSRPMRFLGFSNYEKGAPRQEISKWSTVCSTFSRSGWSVVRSLSLAKGGTSKKRPSPHLHKVPTRSNKVSPRTFQTALLIIHLTK
jgi:hypothetical protein